MALRQGVAQGRGGCARESHVSFCRWIEGLSRLQSDWRDAGASRHLYWLGRQDWPPRRGRMGSGLDAAGGWTGSVVPWGERSTVPTASSAATPSPGSRSPSSTSSSTTRATTWPRSSPTTPSSRSSRCCCSPRSVLGFVLQGDPELQEEILSSALSQFPIVGDQLGRPRACRAATPGSWSAALAALYGVLGLGQAVQNAINVAWAVPRNSRPNPVCSRLQAACCCSSTAGLTVLAVIGVSGARQRHRRCSAAGGRVAALADHGCGRSWSSERVLTAALPARHRAPASFRQAAPGRLRWWRCSGRGCSTSARSTSPGCSAETSAMNGAFAPGARA